MENSSILRAASMLGLSSAFWLSGIYFSSSQMVIPCLYGQPAAVTTRIFDQFYHRGLVVVVPLTAITVVSYGTAAYLEPDKRTSYSTAAVITSTGIVWTLVFMMKTITQLLEMSQNTAVRERLGESTALALLKQWKWMNMVRAGTAMAGAVTGLLLFADVL